MGGFGGSWWFVHVSGTWEPDTGTLSRTRRNPTAPSCSTATVSLWWQVTSHLEPGKCLSRWPLAESNPPVHQGWHSLWVWPNSGAPEDQLPGWDLATGAEDRVNEKAAHGGGADVGNVDQGGDVRHQSEHCGKVVPPQWSGSASGHAEVHDHHQGVAWIWIHPVWCWGTFYCTTCHVGTSKSWHHIL